MTPPRRSVIPIAAFLYTLFHVTFSEEAIVSTYFTALDSNVYSFSTTLAHTNAPSLSSCAAACVRTNGCHGFYFWHQTNTSCWLGSQLVQEPACSSSFPNQIRMMVMASKAPWVKPHCPADKGYINVTVSNRTFCLRGTSSCMTYEEAAEDCKKDGAFLLYLDGVASYVSHLPEIIHALGLSTYHIYWAGGYQASPGSPWMWHHTGLPMRPEEYDALPWVCGNPAVRNCLLLNMIGRAADQVDCSIRDQHICEIL